jgi:signal transduction histidine kinase
MKSENTGICIERHFKFQQALTLADGDKIKQVFWNFCQNAVRAMKDSGGTLAVSLDTIGDDWQINFADTGVGMTRQQSEKIFEPFQSGFDGGTGLGLAIVYQIVQAHEGQVWARSRLGEGTTLVLRLRRWGLGARPPAAKSGEHQLPAAAALATVAASASAGGRARG